MYGPTLVPVRYVHKLRLDSDPYYLPVSCMDSFSTQVLAWELFYTYLQLNAMHTIGMSMFGHLKKQLISFIHPSAQPIDTVQ